MYIQIIPPHRNSRGQQPHRMYRTANSSRTMALQRNRYFLNSSWQSAIFIVDINPNPVKDKRQQLTMDLKQNPIVSIDLGISYHRKIQDPVKNISRHLTIDLEQNPMVSIDYHRKILDPGKDMNRHLTMDLQQNPMVSIAYHRKIQYPVKDTNRHLTMDLQHNPIVSINLGTSYHRKKIQKFCTGGMGIRCITETLRGTVTLSDMGSDPTRGLIGLRIGQIDI